MPLKLTPRPALLLLTALFLFSLTACLPVNTRTVNSPGTPGSASDNLLTAAESAFNQGQYRAAVDNYQRYLQSAPASAQLESVLAACGLAAEKAGQLPDAASAYERLIREYPGGRPAQASQIRLAAVYLAAGDPARAGNLAGSLLARETDPASQAGLRLTLAQSQWLQGRYAEAAGQFLAVRPEAADEAVRRAAEEGALACLSHLDVAALEQIQRQYGEKFPAQEATYFLTRQAAESGDRDRTIALADYFARYYSAHPLLPQVRALVKALDEPPAAWPGPAIGAGYDPRLATAQTLSAQAAPATMGPIGPISGDLTVAAILPLSGDGAQYAKEIGAGLKLALSRFASSGALGLTLMDTRGSPEEAARLVSQAAADPKVVVVVGPFLSRESAQAAQAANRAGLPLIAISQRADLTSVGDYIFRIFLTPKHQAEAVARHAVRVQGHQSLGILYPDDNYGRPVRASFESEARRLGAQVVVAEGYEPQTTDWTDLAARLTGGQVARKVSTSFQAKTEFTALYLPDSAAPVSQIMAQLAFHDITRMQYLGSPLWLSPDFLASSARYTQGAVIPVAWSDLSQREESRRFFDSFKAASGHAPDQFAAYGYDAGLAIVKALGQGADSRDGLRRALSQVGPVPGATGPFSFDHTGEYVVEPALLSVKGREFILLSEAGPGLR